MFVCFLVHVTKSGQFMCKLTAFWEVKTFWQFDSIEVRVFLMVVGVWG